MIFEGKSQQWAVLAAITAMLSGIPDKIHQAYAPGRDSSMTDIALNMLGAGLEMWFFLVGRQRARMPYGQEASHVCFRHVRDPGQWLRKLELTLAPNGCRSMIEAKS